MTEAETFQKHLADAKAIYDDDETSLVSSLVVIDRRGTRFPQGFDGETSEKDLGLALLEATQNLDVPHSGWVPLIVELDAVGYKVEFALEGLDGPIRLRFEDGSEWSFAVPNAVELGGVSAGTSSVSHTTDVRMVRPEQGTALLEPISAEEYGTVEVLIGLLQDIVDSAALNETEHAKVQAALEVLQDTHRMTEVGESQRHELWTVTKRIMRYIYKEIPVDLTKWGAAVGVLSKVWPMAAEFLRTL